MFDQCRAPAQSEPTREQIFTERYEILLAWPLQLTNQHRYAAEDLVQDAFVQFMLARTQLEEIENINGYLPQLLLDPHLSRMTRVSQRAGSVLILRFFLDYFPTEMATALGTTAGGNHE